ncbi:hypothetical protein [Nocardioides sp. SYSU DS0663]|uniref:hypothetical protein n=1 Tax=Nocardioides sp. SYSU DS0663 TaxID=3416445 RepID=UPI003F4C125D
MPRTVRNLVLGGCYVALAALGALLVVEAGDRLLGLLSGLLLLLVAAAGLALVCFDSWYVTHRPGPRVGTAPSGLPATVVARSPVPTVLSAVVPALLAGWALLGCVLAAGEERPVAAVVLGLLAALLASPLLAVARRQVSAGGLWLTAAGIEHRKEGVGWSVPWEDVTGAVPGEPLAVLVRAQPRLQRTTRLLWQREPAAPAGALAVDSRYLAADPAAVAAVVARCVAEPGQRARMGTPEAVRQIAAVVSRA